MTRRSWIPWVVVVVLLVVGHAVGGPAMAPDLVDGALFIVLFRILLGRRLGIVTLPAGIVTVGSVLRSWFGGSEGLSTGALAMATLVRYAVTAILLLVALAISSRRSRLQRMWNCTVVGFCAWFLGGTIVLLWGRPVVVPLLHYVTGSGLVGMALGLWCVIVEPVRPLPPA